MKDTTTFIKYYEYMESVKPKLIKAEQTVDDIKNSKEWKTAFGYFQTLYTRGQIKERPTKKNGYKIEKVYVKLSDIESILSPDQLEQIKKMI